jgi:hypothetical protein
MSLDAFVFCDCYEKGKLLKPPPAGISLQVQPDGSLCHDGDSIEADRAWYQWKPRSACKHEGGVLLHHRLGNIALIRLLRSELQREPSRFPILLGKVLHSGTHSGDYLPFEFVPALQGEVEGLINFRSSTPEAAEYISHFRVRMSELVAASLSVTKPIAF